MLDIAAIYSYPYRILYSYSFNVEKHCCLFHVGICLLHPICHKEHNYIKKEKKRKKKHQQLIIIKPYGIQQIRQQLREF